mgnify:CR=1 FL=1
MQWLYRIMMKGLEGVLIFLTGLVTLSVGWGVFTRYVLHSASEWTGELSGYCLVWITFLGSAYAIFKRSHIRFETLVELLPRPLQFVIETLFCLMMLVFVSVITVYGARLAFNSMNDQTLSLPFSKGVVFLILPIGGILMVVGFLMELFKLWGGLRFASKRQRFDESKEIL